MYVIVIRVDNTLLHSCTAPVTLADLNGMQFGSTTTSTWTQIGQMLP